MVAAPQVQRGGFSVNDAELWGWWGEHRSGFFIQRLEGGSGYRLHDIVGKMGKSLGNYPTFLGAVKAAQEARAKCGNG